MTDLENEQSRRGGYLELQFTLWVGLQFGYGADTAWLWWGVGLPGDPNTGLPECACDAGMAASMALMAFGLV